MGAILAHYTSQYAFAQSALPLDGSSPPNRFAPRACTPRAGGYLNQHDDEEAVMLTTCSSVEDWSPDIFYLAHPVRITIDTTQLDPALFGPDLNSLLDEGCVGAMEDQELDAYDPLQQTLENSLTWTGNCRYLAPIPTQALIAFEQFIAPRDWKMRDAEAHLYGPEHDEVEAPNLTL
jgi:hypothetical protein